MAVNAIASVTAAYVQQATSSSQSAAMQEANETSAVTQKEAARGDMQAVHKLAKAAQQAAAMNPTPSPVPTPAPAASTATTVDTLA
jgi:hypothetical protein